MSPEQLDYGRTRGRVELDTKMMQNEHGVSYATAPWHNTDLDLKVHRHPRNQRTEETQ